MSQGKKLSIFIFIMVLVQLSNAVLASGINTPFDNLSLSASKFKTYINHHAHREIQEDWHKAKSNPNFSFLLESLKPNSGKEIKVLKVKNIKTNKIYTLFKSSLLDKVGAHDVSPDGKVVAFQVINKEGDGYDSQTYVLSFASQKGFLLGDGILRKDHNAIKLVKAGFNDKEVVLSFSKAGEKGLSETTVNLKGVYSHKFEANSPQQALKAFYGGSLPQGLKELYSERHGDKTVFNLVLDHRAVAGKVLEHEVVYDKKKNAVISMRELGKKKKLIRVTYFTVAGNAYDAEVRDQFGHLLYNKASYGKPMADVASLYSYLYREVLSFYNGQLPKDANVVINGNKIDIDLGGQHLMPLHTLRFAFAFDKYNDYGFYFLEERSYKAEFRNKFVFPSTNKKIKLTKNVYGKVQELEIEKSLNLYASVMAHVEGLREESKKAQQNLSMN